MKNSLIVERGIFKVTVGRTNNAFLRSQLHDREPRLSECCYPLQQRHAESNIGLAWNTIYEATTKIESLAPKVANKGYILPKLPWPRLGLTSHEQIAKTTRSRTGRESQLEEQRMESS